MGSSSLATKQVQLDKVTSKKILDDQSIGISSQETLDIFCSRFTYLYVRGILDSEGKPDLKKQQDEYKKVLKNPKDLLNKKADLNNLKLLKEFTFNPFTPRIIQVLILKNNN